jgi:hypothetical protein
MPNIKWLFKSAAVGHLPHRAVRDRFRLPFDGNVATVPDNLVIVDVCSKPPIMLEECNRFLVTPALEQQWIGSLMLRHAAGS